MRCMHRNVPDQLCVLCSAVCVRAFVLLPPSPLQVELLQARRHQLQSALNTLQSSRGKLAAQLSMLQTNLTSWSASNQELRAANSQMKAQIEAGSAVGCARPLLCRLNQSVGDDASHATLGVSSLDTRLGAAGMMLAAQTAPRAMPSARMPHDVRPG